MKDKIALALKSRTFYSVLATVIVNAVNANAQFIPTSDMVYVNLALAGITSYFHVNPSQNYAPKA
jgi:hypothetical protein